MNAINLISIFLMYLSVLAFFWVNKKYYLITKISFLFLNSIPWWEKVSYYASPFIACYFIVQSFRHLFFGYDILSLNLAYISFIVFFFVEAYQYRLTGFKPHKREEPSIHEALSNQKTSRCDYVLSILALFGFILGIVSLLIAQYVLQKSLFEQLSLICFSFMRIGLWGMILKDRPI